MSEAHNLYFLWSVLAALSMIVFTSGVMPACEQIQDGFGKKENKENFHTIISTRLRKIYTRLLIKIVLYSKFHDRNVLNQISYQI